MRIIDAGTGQVIERPLDKGMARELGNRICKLRNIKETPAQYKARKAKQARQTGKGRELAAAYGAKGK